MCIVSIVSLFSIVNINADEVEPYLGVPNITISLSGLDESGKLIYAGIDFAVFEDPDGDGEFTVKADKVKRFLTTHTNISIDLGPPSGYTKGILHKMAYRTLYAPVGVNQDLIVIADYDNGKEGWIPLDLIFKPTYFGNLQEEENPYIRHTDTWEANRDIYNLERLAAGESSRVRNISTFWSGEKFMIHVVATEIVDQVNVKILNVNDTQNNPYETTITEYRDNPDVSGSAIYEGEIWNKDMINRWGGNTPKVLEFEISVTSGSGIGKEVLESLVRPITVDNKELFYRHYNNY